tara:strand:+ start:3256 stop:3414 length:159 start_codon:yes stop_codon:yes gene_type:complete
MSDLSDFERSSEDDQDFGRFYSGQNQFGNHGFGFFGRLILPPNEADIKRVMQ